MKRFSPRQLCFASGLRAGFLWALFGVILTASPLRATIQALTVDGNHFKDSTGAPVRFWGVNLVAFYPTHAEADAIAANLAAREVNVVRPHHDMRNSVDWNTISGIPALVTYVNDTRTPDTEAWDRFDYLNAQLRAKGIYVVLSLHGTRRFLAGDVDIQTTDSTDRTNWMNAITALNASSASLDLYKMLPMIDERSAELMEEFARTLLTHVNPYTGIAYGQDPQVLYLETMNETSSEYTIIAGNQFPSGAAYFTNLLQSQWDAYTAAHGVTPNSIYTAGTTAQRQARSDFLQGLDQTYFNRIKTLVRGLGCQTPIEFSNLWRGDRFQKLEESLSDVAEEHDYDDPLVPRTPGDAFNYFARSTPVGHPYFIGELNEGQTDALINANSPYRAIFQLAASAYGAFNDWSGITWFAWAHGDKMVGNDGWSIWEERRPAVNSDIIGQIESDGLMLDHLRTAGILFKRGLVAPSAAPITWYADDPLGGNLNYTDMMTPKYQFKLGWQNIHAIKRAFGTVPASQATADWMTTDPANPLISDTNEIRKDTTRQQLTVSVPQAEAFGGLLDASAPAGLTHLGIGATSGSATVIVVSDDGLPLSTSQNLIISRTYLDASNNEVANPVTTLAQLKAPDGANAWYIKRTRPRGETGYDALTMTNGVITLPTDGWHEAELKYAPVGSLPPRQSTAQTGDILRPVFDDAMRIAAIFNPSQGGFSVNTQQVIDPSTTFTPAEGSKSARIKFTAGFDPCVLGLNFTNSAIQAVTLDFTPWRSTAGLRFWVYPKRNVAGFSIELACDNGGQLVEVRLPLANYLQPADFGNKWVEVTVPFSDFPDLGIHYDSTSGTTTSMAFLWDHVKGVGFYCPTTVSGYYDPYYDNMRVIRIVPNGSGPAAPTNLAATAGNTQVSLSWTASTGATVYHVKRATTSGGPYSTVASPTTTTYTDTTVSNGTTYYYVVSAASTAGEGPNSTEVSASPQGLPAAPTGLSATAGDGKVNLHWNASTGATSYNLKRGTASGGPYTTIGSPTTTSSIDSTVTNGTTYYYVVTAINAIGEGAASTEVNATPQATVGTVTVDFVSVGAEDGFVQESSQTSNVGGSFSATGNNSQALIIGDTNSNRQNKLIVSFDTSSIPATATILSATLKLCRGALIGSDPFATMSPCYVDIKGGTGFNGSTALEAADFQAAADATQVATMSDPTTNGSFSTGSLNATGIAAINRSGTTQLRVYLALGDNGNSSNDYLGFYSGEYTTAANRPVLEVVYQSGSAPAPAITSASTANSTYGQPFSYTTTATNAPTSYAATGLPAGLTIDPATGVIAGNASAAGTFAVTLTATNAGGTGHATLTLSVAKAVASIALQNLRQTFDGSPKPPAAATTPSGLAVDFSYAGNPAAPVDVGSYQVAATIDDANYTGTTANTLSIAPAPATVALGNLSQIYDGSPKAATAVTAPAGLPVAISYAGQATAPVDAGTYPITAVVTDPNYAGSASGTLTIGKASASIALGDLTQSYDGTAKTATATADPAGLAVTLSYDGTATPPILPGAHAVSATIDDANHAGTATGTLLVTISALARHAPAINGGLDGSVQVLTGESLTLNGGAWVSGDLLVPGTPTLQLNGAPTYAGLQDSGGATTPSGYGITLNSGSVLRYVAQHTDPLTLPTVAAPPAPTGTRDATLNNASDSPGDFSTLRNLTLNSNVGAIAVPPATYGTFTANDGSGFVLGVAGASTPASYSLQRLTLNGTGSMQVVGPVVLTLANGVTLNGTIGNDQHPEWLTLQIATGGLTLNSGAKFYGTVVAPSGAVMLGSNSTLRGSSTSDSLTINSQALLDGKDF